jgi:hypothetical protein
MDFDTVKHMFRYVSEHSELCQELLFREIPDSMMFGFYDVESKQVIEFPMVYTREKRDTLILCRVGRYLSNNRLIPVEFLP